MGNFLKSIPSLNPQHVIDIYGFDSADDISHMIEWLRKGRNFREFVVRDVEEELYAQDRGAQLLSLTCKSKPDCKTKARRQVAGGSNVVVTEALITFPLQVRVKASDGVIWDLEIMHQYHATCMDVPDEFKLRLNFTVMAHQPE